MTDTVISMDSPTSKDDNFSLQQQTTNAEDVTETTLARMTHLAKQQENQFALLRNRPLPPAPISTKGNSNTMGKLRRRRHHASDEELCCNILPGLVTFLALAGFVVGALIVVPYIFYTTPFWIAFHDALAICELYMVLANYFKCMRTPPGSVQSDWDKEVANATDLLTLEPNKHGKPRFCHICNAYKPPRAHHSSFSNKCVLRMDHYCIWVNNVVGCHNHKFFYLFLLYTVIGLCHFYCVAAVGFVKFAMNFDAYNPLVFVALLIFSVFMCPISIMVTLFLGWQSYLIATNQTSIEYHNNNEIATKIKYRTGKKASFQHIYNVDWITNIKSFLGNDPKHWFLPTQFDGSDGIQFATLPDAELKKFQECATEAAVESEGEEDYYAPAKRHASDDENVV